jgi:hypothetical protein
MNTLQRWTDSVADHHQEATCSRPGRVRKLISANIGTIADNIKDIFSTNIVHVE